MKRFFIELKADVVLEERYKATVVASCLEDAEVLVKKSYNKRLTDEERKLLIVDSYEHDFEGAYTLSDRQYVALNNADSLLPDLNVVYSHDDSENIRVINAGEIDRRFEVEINPFAKKIRITLNGENVILSYVDLDEWLTFTMFDVIYDLHILYDSKLDVSIYEVDKDKNKARYENPMLVNITLVTE